MRRFEMARLYYQGSRIMLKLLRSSSLRPTGSLPENWCRIAFGVNNATLMQNREPPRRLGQRLLPPLNISPLSYSGYDTRGLRERADAPDLYRLADRHGEAEPPAFEDL